MENNAETVPPSLPELGEDKEKENRKTQGDKGEEEMERRAVTTLAETFQRPGGPLKMLAKQRFVINLVKRFSSSSRTFLPASLFLTAPFVSLPVFLPLRSF